MGAEKWVNSSHRGSSIEASMIVLRSENIFIVTPKIGLIQDSIILIFKIWRVLGVEKFFWHTVHTGHLRIRMKSGCIKRSRICEPIFKTNHCILIFASSLIFMSRNGTYYRLIVLLLHVSVRTGISAGAYIFFCQLDNIVVKMHICVYVCPCNVGIFNYPDFSSTISNMRNRIWIS